MPLDHPSPQERAVAIAKEVDQLFSLNRDYFLSNVKIFKLEDAARKEREKDAEKTSDEAAQAIVEELEAIKAGKATPSLTDKKKRPGPGWEWQTVFPNSKDGAPVPHMAEGWIPPEAVQANEILSEVAKGNTYWPGAPTPATMVALLGALHDESLPNSPPILDHASGKPRSVAQAQDPGLWALYRARLWCVCAKRGATDRLDALETYLNHAKPAIAEVQTAKRGTAPPATKTPRELARRIALKVDHLFRQNPARWKEQWAVAMRDAEEWHAREEEARKRRQEALDAIWREKHAVETGTAKPRLTDEATSPGEGWRWQWVEISDPANRLRVQNFEAWMPPDALGWMPDANSPTEKIWPGPDPTLPAMYLTLAVLHDGIGEGWGKILDSTTADSGAVGFIEVKNFNDGAAELSIRDLPDPGELRYSAQGVERLETYLNAVRADFEAKKKTTKSGQAEADTPPKSSAADPEELRQMEAADPVLSAPPQYRDPTWPGVFVEGVNDFPTRWMSGASPDWRANYAALAERAERMAADRRKSAAERKDARELATLLRRYVALETPRILEGQAAREYLDEMDRVGSLMQALAVRLGFASAAQPVYVLYATVKGRVLGEKFAPQKQIQKAWAAGGARQAGDEKTGGRQGIRDEPQASPTAPVYEFKIVGEVWHVRFGDEYGELVDRVGMARILTLLLQPNPAEAITALKLCGIDEPGIEEKHASHQEVLDARTRRECREKLAELSTDLDEANNSGNLAEAERLTGEREVILKELRKDRTSRRKGKELGPKDAREKAAEAVSRSLKTIYATLRKKGLPKAADHLEKAIKIESYAFAYRPGPQSPAWHF